MWCDVHSSNASKWWWTDVRADRLYQALRQIWRFINGIQLDYIHTSYSAVSGLCTPTLTDISCRQTRFDIPECLTCRRRGVGCSQTPELSAVWDVRVLSVCRFNHTNKTKQCFIQMTFVYSEKIFRASFRKSVFCNGFQLKYSFKFLSTDLDLAPFWPR